MEKAGIDYAKILEDVSRGMKKSFMKGECLTYNNIEKCLHRQEAESVDDLYYNYCAFCGLLTYKQRVHIIKARTRSRYKLMVP